MRVRPPDRRRSGIRDFRARVLLPERKREEPVTSGGGLRKRMCGGARMRERAIVMMMMMMGIFGVESIGSSKCF